MKLARPLGGDGVTLKSLSGSDATEAYLGWMNDPHVGKYLESRFAEHTKQSLVDFIAASNEAANVLLAGIFLGDAHVGNIKVHVDRHHKRGEIGILIGDRGVWGRGVARRAIALLSDYAFAVLGVEKLCAGCYADNIASMKAFEAAGFQREAVRPAHYISGGKRVDGIYFSRFASPDGARRA